MVNATPQEHAQDNQARREARQQSMKAHEDQLNQDRQDQIRLAHEKMQQDAKLRPTPTPEEINKARSGQSVDEKEPDGSPEQNPHHRLLNAAQQIEVGREVHPAQSASVNNNDQAKRDQREQRDRDRQAVQAAKSSQTTTGESK